jgi:hypothetical protein
MAGYWQEQASNAIQNFVAYATKFCMADTPSHDKNMLARIIPAV